MISNIPTNWKQVIQEYDNQQTTSFDTFIKHERLKFQDVLNIYPRDEDVFRCFCYFDINETKKVIIVIAPAIVVENWNIELKKWLLKKCSFI